MSAPSTADQQPDLHATRHRMREIANWMLVDGAELGEPARAVAAEETTICLGVSARSYLPEVVEGSAPILLVLHHGGRGEPDDAECRVLASSAHSVVVTAGYRVEAQPSGALDDCDRVLQWVRAVATDRWDADPARIVVVGIGEQGSVLARGLTERAAKRGLGEIAAQILIGSAEDGRVDAATVGATPDVVPSLLVWDDQVEHSAERNVPVEENAARELAELIRAGAGDRTAEVRPPAVDVASRVESGTLEALDRLARWDTGTIASIRASYGAIPRIEVPPSEGVEREDQVISSADGHGIPVRWYRPVGVSGPLPTLVYFHGGAFIMGTLDENDDRLDQFVREVGCAVVSVDYRLAPENPFPAGLDDAEMVWRAIIEDPDRFRVDPDRLVVAGGSAGAGLAAALCIRLKDRGMPQPRLQLLIYPMLDDREWPSIAALRGGPGHWGLWQLRAERLSWAAYLGRHAGDPPPSAAPGRATPVDVRGVASAFIGIGDVDSLLDSNLQFAATLSRGGVPVELHVYPGVIHGGFLPHPQTPHTRRFLEDAYVALRRAFSSKAGLVDR